MKKTQEVDMKDDTQEVEIDAAIEVTHRKKTLKCVLTEAELLTAARAMADAQSKVADLEDELDQFKAQNKGKLTAEESIASAKGSIIRCGYEFREVDCDIVSDHKTGMVTTMRNDTHEVIESREMTEAEKQQRLPL